MPVLSNNVSTAPQSEVAWKCDACGHVFDKSLTMCPQCTAERVTEIRMPKTRKGQVEAEQEARQAPTGPDAPQGSSEAADRDPAHPAEGTPYEGWVKKDLQRECENREIPKSGNLADLVGRLVEHDSEHAEPEGEGDGSEGDGPEGDGPKDGDSDGVEAATSDPS